MGDGEPSDPHSYDHVISCKSENCHSFVSSSFFMNSLYVCLYVNYSRAGAGEMAHG